MITREELDAAVWGIGYGSRKHLVDHKNSRPYDPSRGKRYSERQEKVMARCSSSIYLSFFDAQQSPYVSGTKPCARCQKIADRAEGDQ